MGSTQARVGRSVTSLPQALVLVRATFAIEAWRRVCAHTHAPHKCAWRVSYGTPPTRRRPSVQVQTCADHVLVRTIWAISCFTLHPAPRAMKFEPLPCRPTRLSSQTHTLLPVDSGEVGVIGRMNSGSGSGRRSSTRTRAKALKVKLE